VIFDAEQSPPKPGLESDVCIIGAGAAGIALARALAAQGKTVTLLEGGGLQREAFSTDLYRGEVTTSPFAHTSGYLTASRLRYFGGSTNHWTGWCRPLDPLDFEARPWIPHSGWPIGRPELDPYYRRAAELLQIEAFDRPGTEAPAAAFPGADSAFERAHFQMSPPTRFGSVYRDELSRSETSSVWLHANVTRIETDPADARVDHVEVQTPAGESFRVGAESFVLATGGIENARMLLVSNRVRPEGLGNAYDRVGRFFMDHPHVTAGYAALSAPEQWFDAFDFHRPEGFHCDAIDVLSLTEAAQRAQLLPNLDVYLQRPRPELPEAVRRATRAFAQVAGLEPPERARAATDVSLRVRLEPLPNPESRVVLDREKDALGVPRARLHWQLSESDASNLEAGLGSLARELGQARFGRAQQPQIRSEPWPATNFGAHHLGTTRMHADPRRGVVDADCRVHDLANLYIAGSSVFTTAGSANPTLTIIALALRLADHLGGGAHS
jgi:choline dehydrogenase-like flavoprotein